MRYVKGWTLAVAALAMGCDGGAGAPPPAEKQTDEASAASPAPALASGAGNRAVDGGDANRSQPQSVNSASLPGSDTAPVMIIRTGNASVQVDSVEVAVGQLRAIAGRFGGYVANTTMQAGQHQLRSATLELKVPAARFDELTSGLSGIGTVEYVNVSAQDVGEEFVDIGARVVNSRRLEERLIELLATRTGKLQDVLSVERELARVREEIERYEGRLRYLKSRTALSTLSVTVHEAPPLVSDSPGSNIIVRAFVEAWRNFVRLLAAVISSLGIVIPLAAAVWAGILLVRKVRGR